MTQPWSDPASKFACGEQQYRDGSFSKAAVVFEELTRETPGTSGPLRMLGLCQLRLGHPAIAVELLARAHAVTPDDPYTRLHYGMGLHAVGRNAEAAEHFRACQSSLPYDPAPFLNLASTLLALGRPEAALDAARRARRRAPKMPQAHYMEGLTLLACERFAAAAEGFVAALRLAPDFADAWVNLGVARYRAGNIDGAKTAMRRALKAVPGHRAAAANLGAFLRLTGEPDAGEALLRDVVARDPGAAEVRLNLAAELLQEERTNEVLALLDDQSAPLEPRLARHWVMQRSLALIQQRRIEEARAALAQLGAVPRELQSLWLWRQILLATADGDTQAARLRAQEMEAALAAGASLIPEHRIMGHFDLARFWSAQREPVRAFPHWQEGHRLLAPMQPFSREAHRRFVDATTACFSGLRLRDGPRAKNDDRAPVFIVGMPRSGTTLAEQIIAAHPLVIGAGERPALGRAFHALGGGERPEQVAGLAALDAHTLDQAAMHYLAELHALAPDATRIVDKMPGNFNYLGLAALLLPGARIIHCVRDPRDIGLSIFTYRFYGFHPYAHDLGDLGWYIGEHERLMAHWRAALPNPILTVHLKDWVEDFDNTLNRVLGFLDLPHDPACGRFYEQETRVRTVSRVQVRQPVNARGLGRWRVFEQQLTPLIEALTAAGMALD